MANSVKSVSFKKDEASLLEHAEKQDNFSEYVKRLIKADKEKGYKFSTEQEKAIIDLIKKYAPAAKEEEIQKDFGEEAFEFMNQFE